jgi:hypothetical protein
MAGTNLFWSLNGPSVQFVEIIATETGWSIHQLLFVWSSESDQEFDQTLETVHG